MPQTLVFLHRLRYVLSVPLSLTNSPIYSIFLLGDSNIQTLVFLHRLSIFLLGYEHLCAIKKPEYSRRSIRTPIPSLPLLRHTARST